MRAVVVMGVVLLVGLAGCELGRDATPKGQQPAAKKIGAQPTQTVEGGYVWQMRREYDANVLAYEKKYRGKWVLVRMSYPITLRKDYRGYYLIEGMFEGDAKSGTAVLLTDEAARKLSGVMEGLMRETELDQWPVVRTQVDEDGFGFGDHKGELVEPRR
jgi:hypothetical protein